ncbi:MAG: CC0125/CC1285 family lipoprotein [Caulobacteraceae bacterium]
MPMKWVAILVAVGLAASLAACETATPYQPLSSQNAVSGGFSDQRIEPDRFRVTFQGNSLTSRKRVEDYLLYRSAELTLNQGDDWFETVDRHTDRNVETYGTPVGPYPYWRPYWRYWGGWRGRGWGWSGWGPWWGDPFWGPDFDVETVQRFQASTEIVMHRGPKPAGDPRAFDARAVMANLGPTIQRPGQKP